MKATGIQFGFVPLPRVRGGHGQSGWTTLSPRGVIRKRLQTTASLVPPEGGVSSLVGETAFQVKERLRL